MTDWDIISAPPIRYKASYTMQFTGEPTQEIKNEIIVFSKSESPITLKRIMEYLQSGWTEKPTITNLNVDRL